jgi:DNA-binding NarL/FixJ family response regulator
VKAGATGGDPSFPWGIDRRRETTSRARHEEDRSSGRRLLDESSDRDVASAIRNPAYILVVDDDAGFRAAVSELLASAGFATREAATGEEALATARQAPPALVLLDIRLPGTSGYEVLHELREGLGRKLPVIFVSGARTEPYDRAGGLALGADDYIVKPFDRDEFLARVRRLVSWREREDSRRANLTTREHDVLRLLASGLRQAQIAEELVVAPKTVSSHIENILRKLDAHSRAEAVAIAYRDGLMEPPP